MCVPGGRGWPRWPRRRADRTRDGRMRTRRMGGVSRPAPGAMVQPSCRCGALASLVRRVGCRGRGGRRRPGASGTGAGGDAGRCLDGLAGSARGDRPDAFPAPRPDDRGQSNRCGGGAHAGAWTAYRHPSSGRRGTSCRRAGERQPGGARRPRHCATARRDDWYGGSTVRWRFVALSALAVVCAGLELVAGRGSSLLRERSSPPHGGPRYGGAVAAGCRAADRSAAHRNPLRRGTWAREAWCPHPAGRRRAVGRRRRDCRRTA